MTKMTKREKFEMIIATIEALNVADKDTMLECLNHEIELLNKKSSKSGQTKVQKENESLKAEILVELGKLDKPVTVSEFQNLTRFNVADGFSNQKVSALLNQLEKAGSVVKTSDKKKSYFSLA